MQKLNLRSDVNYVFFFHCPKKRTQSAHASRSRKKMYRILLFIKISLEQTSKNLKEKYIFLTQNTTIALIITGNLNYMRI